MEEAMPLPLMAMLAWIPEFSMPTEPKLACGEQLFMLVTAEDIRAEMLFIVEYVGVMQVMPFAEVAIAVVSYIWDSMLSISLHKYCTAK